MAKRLKLEAYRQGISLSELKRRQKLEEISGIGNDANISSVTHSTASDSTVFAAEMVLVHESETPVLHDRSGNEASFSSVTQHNWTNGTSDSACITVDAILACETQVHHNMSGNLASISLVTSPHHTNRTSEHHTNRTRDSGIVNNVILACATPVLRERFEKSNNTDHMSDSGFATKAILPACAMHVHCERFGKSNNTDPTVSNSTGLAAEVVLARESEKPVLRDSNLASISLVMRPHHTNCISDSGFATEAVPACATPVLRERFGKSDLCNRIGNEITICKGSVSSVMRSNSFFSTEAVPACATPVLRERFGKSNLCDRIGNERTICEGIVSSVTHSDSLFATEAVPACATPVFHERFGKSNLCDRIGNERTICKGSVSSVTCQGNIVD